MTTTKKMTMEERTAALVKKYPGLDAIALKGKGLRPGHWHSLKAAEEAGLITFVNGGWYPVEPTATNLHRPKITLTGIPVQTSLSEDVVEKFDIEIVHELKGIDWGNNHLFFTYSFEDETSQFDLKGKWNFGCECYERTYKCRVPVVFENCEEMIEAFIEMMLDRYPNMEGFWVEDNTESHVIPRFPR